MGKSKEEYLLLIDSDNDNKNLKIKKEQKKNKNYLWTTVIILCITLLGCIYVYKVFYEDKIFYNSSYKDIMNDIKLSVIVPAYNTEEFVGRSIESALNSTIKDIEIICINDGSVDNTAKVIKKYVNLNPRVVLIDLKKNKGQSYGRNFGMKIAKGKFYGYLDSDDIIDPKFFENLYNHSKGYDVVIGNLCDSTNFSDKSVTAPLPWIHGYAGDSIYRKEFMDKHNVIFPVGKKIQEDKVFRIDCYKYGPKIFTTTEDYCYFYKKREGSVRQLSQSYIENTRQRIEEYNKNKENE
ncbi:nucleotide-diphospho-sugar transferase [Anaeromyces robustus]|uniref:Nucleotide-diphospho-sugar transferase n=1 Tax=Anaeromyces robustus TaxID=1754192 RepID=A0A1Y1XMR8_9FUNG|nr:nucleotide-diphospho-sugar transferase [Anaeromyces robustus]|eukprot:ORX87039.1 nucleotide-diphospho-sugar transferase [Anaeromyces robustus]